MGSARFGMAYLGGSTCRDATVPPSRSKAMPSPTTIMTLDIAVDRKWDFNMCIWQSESRAASVAKFDGKSFMHRKKSA